MNRLKNKKLKKITAVAMGIMVFFAVLFSSAFLSFEAVHECSHDDCPVCLCMHACEAFFNQLGSDGAASLSGMAVVVPAFLLSVSAVISVFCRSTPVTEKIRLNN